MYAINPLLFHQYSPIYFSYSQAYKHFHHFAFIFMVCFIIFFEKPFYILVLHDMCDVQLSQIILSFQLNISIDDLCPIFSKSFPFCRFLEFIVNILEIDFQLSLWMSQLRQTHLLPLRYSLRRAASILLSVFWRVITLKL